MRGPAHCPLSHQRTPCGRHRHTHTAPSEQSIDASFKFHRVYRQQELHNLAGVIPRVCNVALPLFLIASRVPPPPPPPTESLANANACSCVSPLRPCVARDTDTPTPPTQPKHDSHSDAIRQFEGDFECLSNTYKCPVSLRGDLEPYPSVEVRHEYSHTVLTGKWSSQPARAHPARRLDATAQ